MNPESKPVKTPTEEHKMNALAKEFQVTLTISQPYPSLPPTYSNYYPTYPEYHYSYPSYNYPMMPYKFLGMNQQQFNEDNYYNDKSYVKHIYL